MAHLIKGGLLERLKNGVDLFDLRSETLDCLLQRVLYLDFNVHERFTERLNVLVQLLLVRVVLGNHLV